MRTERAVTGGLTYVTNRGYRSRSRSLVTVRVRQNDPSRPIGLDSYIERLVARLVRTFKAGNFTPSR